MAFQAEPGQPATNQGAGRAAGTSPLKSSMNLDAVNAARAETQKLVAAANSGGFRVAPEAVVDLRNALTGMKADVMRLQVSSFKFAQAPQLGSHPYGHTVAEHDQKAADAEAGSAVFALQQFATVLDEADKALQRAAASYAEGEAVAGDAAKSPGV
jgi:beta-lactamase class D